RKGVAGLVKIFQRKPTPQPETFRAVDGISFTINRGESVGLVGESGCGKSTTSTMVMRLIAKSDGVIMFDGEGIGAIAAKAFPKRPRRRRSHMVSHAPAASLNPGFTAARAIADPILRLGDVTGRAAVRALRNACPPGRLAARAARPLSASALRRTEGARGHRAGDRAQPRSRHSRRTNGGARRVGAGGRSEFAAGAQGLAGDELPIRLPRSQRGAAAVRSGHRHAGGTHRRAGADRRDSRFAASAIYSRPPGRHSSPDLRLIDVK